MIDKIDTLMKRNARILVLRDEFVIAKEQVKTMTAELLQVDHIDDDSMDRYEDCIDYMESCEWRYEQALHNVA